ncbi:MAG: NHLP bacteriocin export ABC transporter permease/ATPase subunit [Desulfovibrionaceae bacterium]
MSPAIPRHRIVLDDPGMVWNVAEGSASVVLEPAPGSGLPRASEVLANVEAGGFVFGLAEDPAVPGVSVYLEAAQGSRLLPLDREDFVARCRKHPELGAKAVLPLVRQVAAWLCPDIPPASVSKTLRAGKNVRLPKGFRVSALAELWVRPDFGAPRLGGVDCLQPLGGEAFTPLTGNMWLEMEEPTRLICVDTEAVVEAGVFLDAMAGFHRMALQAAYERFADAEIKKFMRLVQGARHRTAEFQRALDRAADVLEDEGGSAKRSASPLCEAVRLVGEAQGARFAPPPRLDDDPRRQLEDMLEHNNVFSREVTLTGRWWEHDTGPLLAWRAEGTERRPVALIPGRRGYEAADPQAGRAPVGEAGAAAFETRALMLYPPLPPGKPRPLSLLMFGFRGCGRELFAIALTGLLGGLCGFAVPMATSTIVDKVIANGDNALLWQIFFGLMMIVFGSTCFELTRAFAMLRAESRAQLSLQSAIFTRLLQLPRAFFTKFAAGDLANRVTAADNIRARLSGVAQTLLLSVSYALTNMVLLFFYSWPMALAVLGLLLLTLAVTWVIMRRQMKVQATMQNVIGKLAGLELQLVTGVNKLRASGAVANAFAKWMESFTELRKISYGIGKGTNVVTVYTGALPLLSSITVFGMFIVTGLFQTLSLGNFLCFNSALGQIAGALASLCTVGVSLIFIKPMYQRALPVLETAPEVNAALEDPGELRGAIQVAGVSFVYEGAREPALQNVSIQAAPGEFVAIVGESGSGKSTLLGLLLGFNRPAAGAVLYDGKNLARLHPVKVRRQIGAVIQNGELIQGNIFFNIMGAYAEASEDDAWEAARIAGVDEDIREMPMGMHTFVPHGGGTFSGGQQQRLRIARAVARKPKIFLLDEATSNLDNTIQAKIMDNLRRIHATRIVVAHRLSTVEKADRIYVMSGGRVVESGGFEELMQAKGHFWKLASRQVASAPRAAKPASRAGAKSGPKPAAKSAARPKPAPAASAASGSDPEPAGRPS